MKPLYLSIGISDAANSVTLVGFNEDRGKLLIDSADRSRTNGIERFQIFDMTADSLPYDMRSWFIEMGVKSIEADDLIRKIGRMMRDEIFTEENLAT